MNVCQRNVTRFAHVECMFGKINDIFQGFRSLVSLRLQKLKIDALKVNKFGRTYRTGTQTAGSRCEDLLLFFKSLCERSACETAVIYYYMTTEFHYAKRDSAYGDVMYGEKR